MNVGPNRIQRDNSFNYFSEEEEKGEYMRSNFECEGGESSSKA